MRPCQRERLPSVEDGVVNSEQLPVSVVAILPAGRNQLISDLYHRRGRHLLGLAQTLVDSREEAEEVVQEAFTRLVASFGRIDDVTKADRYVTVAVLNVARSRLRRRRTMRDHQSLIDAGAAATVDDHQPASDEPTIAAVRRAVAALPKRQQQCVVLQYFSHFSEHEIATTLGVSAGSVKTHLSRGRAALAAQMQEFR
jgi:RNA polymerase sigma factor (sigma-70 family)